MGGSLRAVTQDCEQPSTCPKEATTSTMSVLRSTLTKFAGQPALNRLLSQGSAAHWLSYNEFPATCPDGCRPVRSCPLAARLMWHLLQQARGMICCSQAGNTQHQANPRLLTDDAHVAASSSSSRHTRCAPCPRCGSSSHLNRHMGCMRSGTPAAEPQEAMPMPRARSADSHGGWQARRGSSSGCMRSQCSMSAPWHPF